MNIIIIIMYVCMYVINGDFKHEHHNYHHLEVQLEQGSGRTRIISCCTRLLTACMYVLLHVTLDCMHVCLVARDS